MRSDLPFYLLIGSMLTATCGLFVVLVAGLSGAEWALALAR